MTALAASDTRVLWRIDAIRIVDRHRRDLGSLDGLRDSIADVGLLNPVTITPGGRLIAGERRIAACSQLGWTEITVTVAENLDEARAALRAERDENLHRKEMAPSEKAALGKELERLERPKAAERKGGRPPKTEGNFPAVSEPSRGDQTGKVYDIVGAEVGMSGPTYKRAKAVVEAAAAGEAGAAEALEHMDETGKVTPAYNELQAARIATRADGSEMTPRQRQLAAGARQRVEKAIGTCNGIARGLDGLKVEQAVLVTSPSEVEGWIEAIQDAQAALRRLAKRLKESM